MFPPYYEACDRVPINAGDDWTQMKRIFAVIVSILGPHALFGQPAQAQDNSLDAIVEHAIRASVAALRNAVEEVEDRTKYPTYGTKDMRWKLAASSDWTSGFWPGTLWYAYELSSDNDFKRWAVEWTRGIEGQKANLKTHDLGFRFGCSFGNGLRLAPGDSATANYHEILLAAAATMDKRFNPLFGAYTSDCDKKPLPNSIPVVIDIMMNLELLYWASQHGGDTQIADRCISHTITTNRDFIRSDGGSFHIVRYDQTSGAVLNRGQLQGDVDSSTWTRGHAWLVYGMTTMYRNTHDERFLAMAMRAADYFIGHLPENRVAPWDFQSAIDLPDASASAIVASALLELQGYVTDQAKRTQYMHEARTMLRSLCLPPVFSEGKGTNCLLLHSTQYYRLTDNTDVPSTFADYYFLEALVRYKALQQISHAGDRQ